MGAVNSRFAVAVHILALLAIEHKKELTTSEYVARSAGTHPVVIRRLLSRLGRAGLVTAQPGIHGGAQLARPPEEISLLDVYQAVETTYLFSFGDRPHNPGCICGRNLEPVMQEVFQNAERAMETALAGITVAQIAQRVEGLDARSGHCPSLG